ncbi:MAG: FAD-dependent thymidylate synthase [Clostridia bacterium]|nr:FAD-dependent thymidylate synthase [Clostridia bacterium]
MNVTLISHTPSPEKTIAAAAKLCYSPAIIDDIFNDLTDEKAAGFVEMLSEIGHESPIEHASFTFGIEGVSRALLAQITRHRIASYSVQSQRYVSENQFEYVVPPEIEADAMAKAEFLEAMEQAQAHYEKIAEILTNTHYNTMIAEGVDEKKAKRDASKKAIEDARFVLPNACDTKMIVTFNARSLQNFFAHRCCNRAQWEIRELADKMLALVQEVAPNLFKYAGPPCVRGGCPEGKMTCGKALQMRNKYLKK